MKKLLASLLCLLMLSAGAPRDIDYDAIKGETDHQGAPLAPIVNAESDAYPELYRTKGKLCQGVFYWSARQDVEDGLIADVQMPEIKNGRYRFTDGDGYLEITEHRYLQMVGMEADAIDALTKMYAKAAYSVALQQLEAETGTAPSPAQDQQIRETCYSTQEIQTDLIEQRSAFYINVLPTVADTGTDIELTYRLEDYGLWFPLLYHHQEDGCRLVFQELGWEFIYEGDSP